MLGELAAPAAPTGQAAERLRLVPAQQGAGTGSASAPASTAANDGKLRSLQAELAEARRLLDLKNAELAQMQKRLASGAAASKPAGSCATTT